MTNPLDSDLSAEQQYPAFEQPGQIDYSFMYLLFYCF